MLSGLGCIVPAMTTHAEPPRSLGRKRVAAWSAVALSALVAVGAVTWSRHGSSMDAFYERWGVDPDHLPYNPTADARKDVAAARARARESGKMLMVTFGANWCPDCLTLYKNLESPGTREYAHEHFEFVNVDVGQPERNVAIAREMGVNLNAIPVAMFYSSDGEPICDTGDGELRPSRHYSSHDILKFLREVAVSRCAVSLEPHR
jgi:thiol:disulfide interchange protein